MDVEPTVAFVIDELVLDGVEPGDPAVREAVAEALGAHPSGAAAAAAVAEALPAENGRMSHVPLRLGEPT